MLNKINSLRPENLQDAAYLLANGTVLDCLVELLMRNLTFKSIRMGDLQVLRKMTIKPI
jgi:hypothetical protein